MQTMYGTQAIALVGRSLTLSQMLEKGAREFIESTVTGANFLVRAEVEGEKEWTRKLTPFGYKWVAQAKISDIEWELMKDMGYSINPDIIFTETGTRRERWECDNINWWRHDILQRISLLPTDAVLVTVELK